MPVGVPSDYELTCLANIGIWEECLEFVEWLEGEEAFQQVILAKVEAPVVKAAATPTPALPPQGEGGKNGAALIFATTNEVAKINTRPRKKAEVGRSSRDLGQPEISTDPKSGTPALKSQKKADKSIDRTINRSTKKLIKKLAQLAPAACETCGAPGYGKAGRCFEHLLAKMERKVLRTRLAQRRHMAKVRGEAAQVKNLCHQKTENRKPKTENRFVPFERQPGGAPGV